MKHEYRARKFLDQMNCLRHNVQGGYPVNATPIGLIAQALREVERETLERCAQRCDREADALVQHDLLTSAAIARSCANWIRALKQDPEQGECRRDG